MIVVMKLGASDGEIAEAARRIESAGLKPHLSQGVQQTIIGVLGQTFSELKDALESLPATPDLALKDGPQSLTFENFNKLISQLGPVVTAVGRSLAGCSMQANA